MNKLEQLEAKIRELCPELMELSEGCVAIFEGRQITFLEKSQQKKEFCWVRMGVHCFVYSMNEVNKLKIIGHPIRLEHVLKAYLDVKCKELWDWEVGSVYRSHSADITLLWHFGKPWKSQTEVHELLFRILNIE